MRNKRKNPAEKKVSRSRRPPRVFMIIAAFLLIYFANARLHSFAYERLLNGDTRGAVRLAKLVIPVEPNFWIHRGNMGRGRLISSFRETGEMIEHKRLAWTFDTSGPVISSPAYADGAVYIGGNTNYLYKLDARTGRLIWKYDAEGDIETRPLIVGKIVYATAHSGIHAVNADTGQRIWSRNRPWNETYPVYSGGKVFAGDQKGDVSAFDAATGKVLWTFATGAETQSGFVIFKNILIYGCMEDKVYGLDTRTGRRIWETKWISRKIPKEKIYLKASPFLMDGIVYIGDGAGRFVALDAATGKTIWTRKLGGKIEGIPTGRDGITLIGVYKTPGRLFALNAKTGKTVWVLSNLGPIESGPTLDGDTVYIGSHWGHLSAVRFRDGKLLWQFITGWDIDKSTPAVGGGLVFIGSMDGRVYALKTRGNPEIDGGLKHREILNK